MLQRPIDPEEMLSLVEGEQCGIVIPAAKRREIEASPENRTLYAELSASVRTLRAMPLRDAPPSVWSALDAAYDETFGETFAETFGAARERTAASPSGVQLQPPRRIRRMSEARRRWATAVAAACLIAAGITIWSIARTGGDPNLAPNGLRFVETSVARIVDDLPAQGAQGALDEGRVDRGRVIYSFLTRTQTLFQGVGSLDLNSADPSSGTLRGSMLGGTTLGGVAPSAGN